MHNPGAPQEISRFKEPQRALRSFALNDIHALYGGRALWALEDHSSVVVVVARGEGVQRGFWEKRYRVTLSETQWAEVEKLAAQHSFFEIVVGERFGIPDEGRPTIEMTAMDGQSAKIQKWAGTKHPGFEAIYRRLWELCRLEGELICEQPFVWNWRPAGYLSPQADAS